MVQECQDMAKEIEKEAFDEKVVDLKEFRKEIKETLKKFEQENLRK